MKQAKRILALLIAVGLVVSVMPTKAVAAEKPAQSGEVLTETAYAGADRVFDRLEALAEKPATKGKDMTQQVIDTVTGSASYLQDSLELNGATVIWWTTDGVRCMYSPRFEKLSENFVPENSVDEIVNEPAKRGGKPSSKDVYLIAPYYGIDASFSDQYRKEAANIARAIGDTDGYTVYSGRVATIDKVAEAVSKGAVVLFDSHGTTDYEDGFDLVTGATNSYICLNNSSGLTDADFAAGAAYGGDGTVFVNGQTIANHMESNSPGGFCWLAICLGMATDTICTPLRNKGVEVVYGYSQSVSFDGEYLFSEAFWSNFLRQGKTVAQAVSAMKKKYGTWDTSMEIANYYGWLYGCDNITLARNSNRAFPVVVSDEDPYPGKRTSTQWGVDSLQTVRSTYTLGNLPGNGNTSAIEPTIPIDPSDGSGYDTVRFWVDMEGNFVGGWPTISITKDTPDVRHTWMIQSTEKGLLLYYSYFNFDFDEACTDKFVNILLTKNSPTFQVTANFKSYSRGGLLIDQLNVSENFDTAAHRKGQAYAAQASNNGLFTAEENSQMLTECINLLLDTWNDAIYDTHGFGLDYLGFVNYYSPLPQPPAAVPGDMNGDDQLSNDDVLILLWYVLFPEQNPITVDGDINGDGDISNDDVLVLLWYSLFPGNTPL